MAAAVMMATELTAASVAVAWSRTRWRRHQRRAALEAARSKIKSQQELLQEFMKKSAPHGVVLTTATGELAERLSLIAPVVQAGLTGEQPPTIVKQRRNAASHNFQVSAVVIAAASGPELNRIQKGSQAFPSAIVPCSERSVPEEQLLACPPPSSSLVAVDEACPPPSSSLVAVVDVQSTAQAVLRESRGAASFPADPGREEVPVQLTAGTKEVEVQGQLQSPQQAVGSLSRTWAEVPGLGPEVKPIDFSQVFDGTKFAFSTSWQPHGLPHQSEDSRSCARGSRGRSWDCRPLMDLVEDEVAAAVRGQLLL